MKVTQLDFTAIRNANAAQAAANSARLQNKQFDFNAQRIDTSSWMNQRAREVNNQIKTVQAVGNVIDTALSIGETLVKAKYEADVETANNGLETQTTDVSTWLQQEIANNAGSFFDADGNLVRPESYTQKIQGLHDYVDSLDVMDSVKEQGHKLVDSYDNQAWSNISSDLIAINTKARNDAWASRLDDLLEIDLAAGSPDNGLEMIQNTAYLTPAEKQNYSEQYQDSFRIGYNNRAITDAAKNDGYSIAKDLIPTLDTKSQDERDYLDDLAYSVANKETQKNIQDYTEYAANQLSQGISPRLVLDTVEAEISGMKDERRKEDILTSVDNAIYSNGLKALGLSTDKDISGKTGSELDDFKEDFEAQRDMLFPGERLKSSADALSALISQQYDRIASANASTNIETQKHALAMVQDGSMSVKDAAAIIANAYKSDDSDKSDEMASHENLAKLYSYIVPAQFKDYNKQKEENFEDLYAATMSLDSKDAEEFAEIKSARLKAHQYVLGRFEATPGESITQDMIDGWWEDALDIYTGETITLLEDLSEAGKDLVQQNAMTLDTDKLKEYTTLAMEAPEGVITVNSDETVSSSDPLYLEAYGETGSVIITAVDKGGYGDINGASIHPLEVNGVYKPIAVVRLTDGTEYTLLGDVLISKAQDSETWSILGPISAIEGMNDPYFRPEEMHEVPISEDAPAARYSNDQEGNVDERMMSDSENWTWSYVEKHENEERVRQPEPVSEPLIPASEISEDAIAEIQEEEPDIPVRRVYKVGAEFWYQGKWYLINELPENSEVLAAYDRFNNSFDRTWPKVGYPKDRR